MEGMQELWSAASYQPHLLSLPFAFAPAAMLVVIAYAVMMRGEARLRAWLLVHFVALMPYSITMALSPSLVSPVAAEGTGVRDGLEARIAATPKAWVESIAALYEDPAAWAAQQQAAWTFTEREFGLARGRELMQQALEAVDVFAAPEPGTLAHDMRAD